MYEQASKNLKLLNIITFLHGLRAFDGVVAVYFATVTGSYALGMAALAAMSFSASLFEIPTGLFSDRIGRKLTVIVYGLAMTSSAFLLFLADSALYIFMGAIVNGFAIALASGAISAYVYENLEVMGVESEFRKYEGHRQSLTRYGLVISGLLGALVIYLSEIKFAILITMVATFAASLLSLKLKEIPTVNPRTSNIYSDLKVAWKKFRSDLVLRDISIGRIIDYGGGNIEYRLRSLYFSLTLSDWVVNLLGILSNLIAGVTMKYTDKIVKKFGAMKAMVHFDIFEKIITSFLVFVNNLWSAIGMTTLSAMVFGIGKIAPESILQTRYTREQRATMGSILGLGTSMVYGILGILLGLCADKIGLISTMILMQVLLLSSSYFYYKGIKRTQE